MASYENKKISIIDTKVKTNARWCEFCDMTLKSDLDVSKHLVTQLHSSKRDEFLCLQNPHDKAVQKELPKNLSQVYTTLKIRSVRDLVELADKNYFKISTKDANVCGVAKTLSTILLKRMSMFELQSCKHYSQGDIDQILDVLLAPRERGPLYKTPQQGQTESVQQQHNHENSDESPTISQPQKVNARVSANDQPSSSSRSYNSSRIESTATRSQPSKTSKVQDYNPNVPSSTTKPRPSTSTDKPTNLPQSNTANKQPPHAQEPRNSTKKSETSTSDAPIPRLDSTYKPTFMKIKVEPKE